jgi:hypothetical protein
VLPMLLDTFVNYDPGCSARETREFLPANYRRDGSEHARIAQNDN